MKNFKKALATVLAVLSAASVLCMPMGASAEDVSESNIYIKTETVPNDVVSYAKDIFSDFNYEDMYNLNFDFNTISNMRLGNPFDVNDVKENDSNYEFYYFPVISNDEVVALMTVNVNTSDNSMNYQFGADELSKSLNTICTSNDNPVEIYMNDDCCYTVDTNNNIQVLYTFVESTNNNISVTDNSSCSDSSVVIQVDNNNVYDETIKYNGARTSYLGKKLTVVHIDNKTVDGKGTCWASCVGCLATYYTNPTTGGTEQDGKNIRNAAIIKYGSTGGISTAKEALAYYNNLSMTATNSKLSWTALRTQISTNKAPFYTRWSSSGASNHAMVVSGYRYSSDSPSDTSYYGIYVMDPNHGTNILIGYDGTYSINEHAYSWAATLYKS